MISESSLVEHLNLLVCLNMFEINTKTLCLLGYDFHNYYILYKYVFINKGVYYNEI